MPWISGPEELMTKCDLAHEGCAREAGLMLGVGARVAAVEAAAHDVKTPRSMSTPRRLVEHIPEGT
jgi:hypothetical protein